MQSRLGFKMINACLLFMMIIVLNFFVGFQFNTILVAKLCYFTQLKEILASWVLRRRQLVLCGDNQESISCAEADGCLHFHSHQTLQTFEHILHFTFGCLYWHIAHLNFFEPIHILHVLCTHTHTHLLGKRKSVIIPVNLSL